MTGRKLRELTEQQKCLLEYLLTLRQGAVDILMMAGMFFSKMERQALPDDVAAAYDSLSSKQVDELIQYITFSKSEED
jgi:hypothetical protein